jgi:hypothetical protein
MPICTEISIAHAPMVYKSRITDVLWCPVGLRTHDMKKQVLSNIQANQGNRARGIVANVYQHDNNARVSRDGKRGNISCRTPLTICIPSYSQDMESIVQVDRSGRPWMMAMRRIRASSLPEFPKVRAEDHSGADGDNADEAELAAPRRAALAFSLGRSWWNGWRCSQKFWPPHYQATTHSGGQNFW